jgi:tetratricopeptide (TPR) repeat protein
LRGSALTRLIGRDEEIDLLLRHWVRAKTGDGQVVLVSGEPGLGKSRITAALAERLHTEPHLRLRYFCSPYHQDSALYPFIDQLGRAAGFVGNDTPAAKLGKLEALLGQAAPPGEDVAFLADLLSLPPSERHRLPDLSPPRKKERTLEALIRQLEGLASQQPVVMVFEDAHWIDPTSRELLDLTVERVGNLPALLIVTFRPEFQPSWTGQPQVTMLALNRLERRDRTALVEQIAGNKALPDEVVDQIAERTDGVPLFIEELTKSVLESGLLREVEDRYVLDGALPPFAIPTSLHDSLMARLDRLAPARQVAQIGAAIGRRFSHELLSLVSRLPEDALRRALDQLVDSELVFRRGAPPTADYIFKHALVQDATYSTMLRGRRQDLHARIATVLEEHYPEMRGQQPEVLAHHWAEAALAENAIGYWLAAGQQAVTRSAMSEATMRLRKGLDLLPILSDLARRNQYELNLQIALGRALMATQGSAALVTGQAFARARQLCEELDRPTQLGAVLHGQYTHYVSRAELDRARPLAEDMRRLGEGQSDMVLKSLGCRFGGQTCFYLGEFTSALAYLEQALDLFDPKHRSSHAAVTAADSHVVELSFLSRALFCLGELDQARLQSDATFAEARGLAHAYTLAWALAQGWWNYWGARSVPSLLSQAEELITLSATNGFTLWRTVGTMARGWCLVALGEVEGLALINEGLVAYRARDSVLRVPIFLTLLADAYGKARRPKEGLLQLTEATRLVEATHERWVEPEMLRIRGELLNSIEETAAAESSLRTALHVARRQKAKLWELRAAKSLASLWCDQDKCTEGRDLLASIYGRFTEGFNTPDLKEAKALLDELA